MSASYSFYLRVGFQVPVNNLRKLFQHQNITRDEGVFHMEDRYDPKTGAKLEPVKIWDRKAKNKTETWWIIEDERFDDWDDEFMISSQGYRQPRAGGGIAPPKNNSSSCQFFSKTGNMLI